MSDSLPEASGQATAGTSHSMQSEDNRAQIANLHLNDMLDILEKNKQNFITDVEREIEKRFEGLGVQSCLALVEIEEARDSDGSVTVRQLGSYPFRIDVAFWAHLSVFMQQRDADQQQAPVRKLIDWAPTEIVENLIQQRLVDLYSRQTADVAACFLQLERVQLCSHARERLRSSEMPLTTQQLADVSSLDDDEILRDVLQLAPESKSTAASYSLAMAFVRERLPQPNFEWQAKPLITQLSMPRQRLHSTIGKRSNLRKVTRSIVTDQIKLLLVEVLGVTTADFSTSFLPEPAILAKLNSLLEVSSFATRLGLRIATALANDLKTSFTDQNKKLWNDFVLREDSG